MKNTQNYFWLLFLTISFFSCSHDDKADNSQSYAKEIIGTWTLINREDQGEELGVEICELQTTFQFLKDNSFEGEFFVGDDPAHCDSAPVFGDYEFIDKNTMKIKITGISEPTIFNVAFEEEGEILKLIYPDDGDAEILIRNH